jgi:hypothetical protein
MQRRDFIALLGRRGSQGNQVTLPVVPRAALTSLLRRFERKHLGHAVSLLDFRWIKRLEVCNAPLEARDTPTLLIDRKVGAFGLN